MTTAAVVSRAKAYLKVRHKTVRDAMKELNLDGILLTYPPDLAYLTNFTPKLEPALALIPRAGEPRLLVGGGVGHRHHGRRRQPQCP